MITEEEFQRIVKYMKRKAGINLSAKRVLIQGRLDTIPIVSSWMWSKLFRQEFRLNTC